MRRQTRSATVAATVSFAAAIVLSFQGLAQQANTPSDNFSDCYWQDSLNGVFCDHTYSLLLGEGDRSLDWSSETKFFITKHDSYHVSWLDAAGGFYLTPYPWLKLSIDTEFDRFRNEDHFFFTATVPFRGPGFVEQIAHAAYWGERAVEVNAKVFDTGPGDARYFAHVFADIGVVPGEDDIGLQSRLGAGAEAGARWALSSTLALNAKTLLSVDHFADLDSTAVYPSARALLSFDAAGLALGPAYDGAIWTAMTGGMVGRRESNLVGGEGLFQPFKTSANAVLNGIIIDGKAEHTVGPATFETAADGSAANYSATISFNFHY
jgi:hypothetical protein